MNCPNCNSELSALEHVANEYFCQNCKLLFDNQGNEKPQFDGLERFLKDMRLRKPATIHLSQEIIGVCVSDCRTQDGITIGLIDGMIATCRILRDRDFSNHDVKEALKDLATDGDLEFILESGRRL